MEFVSNKQFDGYARRIERENLDKFGRSPTASTISRRAYHLIVEHQNDKDGMLVKEGWREAMRQEEPFPSGMLTVERSPVKSDNIVSAGYDEEHGVIQLEFQDGSIYEYWGRGAQVWQDFQSATSKGRFVRKQLTPAGRYRKVQ